MDNCTFCKIINKKLPSSIVYEDKDLLAFLDIKPINKGHILIIPKQHTELMIELNDKILSKMIVLAKKINIALKKSDLKPEGINLFLADGKSAGQEIFHTHIHIIPRFKNDGFDFVFPKDYNNKPSKNEIDQIANKIKLQM